MASCGKRPVWAAAAIGVTGLLSALGLAGCGKQTPAPPPDAQAAAQANAAVKNEQTAALDASLHQSFADATIKQEDGIPDGWQLPPETTMTGKSVGKLYTQVVGLWDGIRFLSAGGKRLGYHAVLDTEMGPIDITLRPDLAPNHVRSFVALARAGYYDGLAFDTVIHELADGRPDSKLDLIEAGCPLGTGEAGFGSVGYWLKPEISPQATHEEGTVGASHTGNSDAEACKFYITLCPAPGLDGDYTIFGKVTQGLDVARKIATMPMSNDAPEGSRPAKPVIIRKVTIETSEVENWGPS